MNKITHSLSYFTLSMDNGSLCHESMRNTAYYANKQSRNKSAYPHFQVYILNSSLKDEFLDKQVILLFPFLEENLELLSSKPPSNTSHTMSSIAIWKIGKSILLSIINICH